MISKWWKNWKKEWANEFNEIADTVPPTGSQVIEEVEEPKCDHDWEIVERSEEYLIGTRSYNEGRVTYIDSSVGLSISLYIYSNYREARDRVCLKCGECDKGISRAKAEYKKLEEIKKDEKLKAQQRKKIAKIMFEEGCK